MEFKVSHKQLYSFSKESCGYCWEVYVGGGQNYGPFFGYPKY